MQGKTQIGYPHNWPLSPEIRREPLRLHTQISLAWGKNIMFLYHRRADPGVNLNFKQNQAFAQVHPTCQCRVV